MKKNTTRSIASQLDAAKRNPLPWMLTMEAARQRGDLQAAESARQELERLGVEVRYKCSLNMEGGDGR